MNTAMILCAGFGTRMGELTKDIPKPMLKIRKKPMLEYTILHLAKLGINKIFINLHYLSEKITSYFGDGKDFGVSIKYSYEKEPLGTAGAVKNIETQLRKTSDFLLLYGDIVCNEDYQKLFAFHQTKEKSIATIILHERNESNSVVEMDSDNMIIRFIERPSEAVSNKMQNWVNSGIYCLRSKILDFIPKTKFCDFPKDIFPKLVANGGLYGYPLKGYRCAIDSSQRYNQVQEDMLRKKVLF
ncbi:NDP-sugar synthase [Elusimicrobiota bacterium]